MNAAGTITPESRPKLPSYIKLHHDKVRERWILLAPERILEPDDTALEVVRLCDGSLSVRDIAERLGKKYAAPVDQILADVTSMLQDLLDKRFLESEG